MGCLLKHGGGLYPRLRIGAALLAAGEGRLRSARRAGEVARMHGTPIYVMKEGKVAAIKP